MSQENMEIVLASFRAYAAGDIDTALSVLAPDFEALPDASVFPEGSPVRGADAWRKWLEDTATAWVRVEVRVRDVFAVPDGRVVLRQDWGGVGRGSGLHTSSAITGIWTLRSGLVTRIEYHFDHAEALKAVGLKG
jgi:ketosteroid isomerase-like protein